MAKVSPWLFKSAVAGSTEHWSGEWKLLSSWAVGLKYLSILCSDQCRPSRGLFLEKDMNYLDNFLNFPLVGQIWFIFELRMSLTYSLLPEILLCCIPSIWFVVVTLSACRNISLQPGDHPGLWSCQALPQLSDIPQVYRSKLLSNSGVYMIQRQILLRHCQSLCFNFSTWISLKTLGVMVGSSFFLGFCLWLQFCWFFL